MALRILITAGLVACLAAALALAPASVFAQAPASGQGQVQPATYGDLEFPRDEHFRPDSGNYWWGALRLKTRSGNDYSVGFGWINLYDLAVTGGHQIFPRQGPYKGKAIMSTDGPPSWGHESPSLLPGVGELSFRFRNDMSRYDPERSPLPHIRTYDTERGDKMVAQFERVSAERENYRLKLDYDAARVHPDGDHVRMGVDVVARMKSPPLLKGGTGLWWYTMPETFGYDSRSYQYMQAARRLDGTLEIEQPDGSILREEIDPRGSQMVFVREHDATPEDFFVGLGLSVATQLHAKFPLYFQGYVPWDIVFVDLDNGAQLMLAMLAFHESQNGLLPSLGIPADMPTYHVSATLRLPSGESVKLDDTIRVEQLDQREMFGGPTPFLFVDVMHGMWTQSWRHRVSHPRMRVATPSGRRVTIPKFDLGLLPQHKKSEPQRTAEGIGMKSRIPFVARGSWAGCPVRGFGWSELINNWYGYEDQNPWFTGRKPPRVPKRCGPEGRQPRPGSPGNLNPPARPFSLNLDVDTWTSCIATNPGESQCSFVADSDGGLFGFGEETGAWRVVIERPGHDKPIVIRHLETNPMPYRCGVVREGDHVTVIAEQPGTAVGAGNPGICL